MSDQVYDLQESRQGPTAEATLRRADHAIHRPATVVAALAILGTIALSVHDVVRRLAHQPAIPIYQAPQYWLDYRNGFVRRGLPGEVLSLLSSGVPSGTLVTVAGVLLSAGAAVAVLVLAFRLAAGPLSRGRRALVVALVFASPLTLSLLVWDLGRYDAIGVLAMVGIALLPWRTTKRPIVLLAISAGALLVATLSEEFLFAVVAPLLVLGCWASGRWHARTAIGLGVVAAIPAAIAAAASFAVAPPIALLRSTLALASAQGVYLADNNAVATLVRDLRTEIAIVAADGAPTVALWTVGGVAFYVATLAVHHVLTGRRPDRLAYALMAYFALVAVGLGLLGVDYKRWWALALIAALAAQQIRPSPSEQRTTGAVGPLSSVALIVTGAFLLVCLAGQRIPLYPPWNP